MGNIFDKIPTNEPVGNVFDTLDTKQVTKKEDLSAGAVLSGAVKNTPSSAGRFGKSILEAITHPVESLNTLGDAAWGAALHVLPKGAQDFANRLNNDPQSAKRMIETANAIGGMYKERYGTWDAIRHTIKTDPVGFAADLSSVLTGVGGAGRAVTTNGSRVAQVAEGVRNLGNAINPVRPVAAAVEAAPRLAARGVEFGYNRLVVGPKGMTYLRAAEDRAIPLRNALRHPAQIVPGSLPTAAEAASPVAATRFSAMGETAKKTLPSEYRDRLRQQNAARVEQVRQVGQTQPDLVNAENIRELASGINYSLAGISRPGVAPLRAVSIPLDPDFHRLSTRPAMAEAIRDAQEIAANEGRTVFDASGNLTGHGAHDIKTALDQAMTPNANTANRRRSLGAIRTTQTEFLDWLEDYSRNPAYGTARQAHELMSEPIDQMIAGRYLENRLVPVLGEETAALRASGYAGAMDNPPETAVIQPGRDPDRIRDAMARLTPEQRGLLDAVREDLVRAKVTEQDAAAARGSGPNPTQAGTEAVGGLRTPPLINIWASAINKIMQITQGRIDQRTAVEIAREMLEPRDAGNVLGQAMRRRAVGQMIGAPIGTIGQVGSDVIRTPAVYNMLAPGNQESTNALR